MHRVSIIHSLLLLLQVGIKSGQPVGSPRVENAHTRLNATLHGDRHDSPHDDLPKGAYKTSQFR
jgi:hypothetical protein